MSYQEDVEMSGLVLNTDFGVCYFYYISTTGLALVSVKHSHEPQLHYNCFMKRCPYFLSLCFLGDPISSLVLHVVPLPMLVEK